MNTYKVQSQLITGAYAHIDARLAALRHQPDLQLEIEDDDSRRHREDREAAARERKRQREELEERRRRPLSGSRGDFEQTRLFGKEELFQ